MKPLWVNRMGEISEGALKGISGKVVAFDSAEDEATIQVDDITYVQISSDYVLQSE